MPNDLSQRGYNLPHPNNIASQDVVRIRETIIAVDIPIAVNTQAIPMKNLDRMIFKAKHLKAY